ncbi:MAG: hypothetical protein KC503_39660 [Myxococcales bacterium]|nr:hypothetical protein [Myxococcales bacterium]
MIVFEGETLQLAGADVAYLQHVLGGRLRARPSGWAISRVVGHLAMPSGETLRVRSPKAPAAAVLAWIAYADPTFRSLQLVGEVDDGAAPDDLAALAARLFTRALLLAAARHGLTRRYLRQQVRSATVRGAIDFAALVRQGGDIALTPCIVWQRLPDTPLNRLLAAALARVQRDALMRAACRRDLAQASALLAGVRPAIDGALLSGKRQLGRTERPYAALLSLARLIVAHSGLGDGATSAGPAFIVDLEALFERTVVRGLREAGIRGRAKAPVLYLRLGDDGQPAASGAMEMDFFAFDVGGEPLVVDAKYKRDVSSANLQQMVTYCFVSGARRAVLVLPAGHLADRRDYRFVAHAASDAVQVHLVELATSATNSREWRDSSGSMASAVLRTCERSRTR